MYPSMAFIMSASSSIFNTVGAKMFSKISIHVRLNFSQKSKNVFHNSSIAVLPIHACPLAFASRKSGASIVTEEVISTKRLTMRCWSFSMSSAVVQFVVTMVGNFFS